MRVGRAKDGNHSGQRGVGASAHVQRLGSQPGRVDADHLRTAAVQLANSAAALTGQVTTLDSAPLRSSTLISRVSGCCAGAGSCKGMNAARGEAVSEAQAGLWAASW